MASNYTLNDLDVWAERFQQVASLTDRKYVVIVNDADFWQMTARLFHNPQVRVQSSIFVKQGHGYVVPDPEDSDAVESAGFAGYSAAALLPHPATVLAERGIKGEER